MTTTIIFAQDWMHHGYFGSVARNGARRRRSLVRVAKRYKIPGEKALKHPSTAQNTFQLPQTTSYISKHIFPSKFLIMKSLLHLLTLLTATSAMVLTRQDEPEGNSTRELKNCPEPDEAFLKLTDEFAKEEGNEENITARADVTINTWVHVVATSRNVEDGWVSVSRLFPRQT